MVVEVNVAKDVIQHQLGLDNSLSLVCKKNDKHQTHELLFGDPLKWSNYLTIHRNFFPFAAHPRWKSIALPLPSIASSGLRIPSHHN